ncbi:MAG TPA: AAA family ATPase [Fibrobacteria bacterium]|nr:AAA family ATPase [Fibrobacteria bacterium]
MNLTPGPPPDTEDLDLPLEEPRRIPSISSLLHVIWLRKWPLLYLWLVLAIPAGVLLSIFDLPKSYSSTTVLRFPSVVGAQTNVMRDIAITQRESIISIFRSYQVLESAVKRLRLRLRVRTSDVFPRNTFAKLDYSEDLGLGTYTLHVKAKRAVEVRFRPRGGSSDYVLYDGAAGPGQAVDASGLLFELHPQVFGSVGLKIELELRTLEEAVAALKKNLTTSSMGASNFSITLEDRDPWLVADMVNVLREEFLRVYYGTTEVQEVGVLAQLEKDLDLAKERLQKSQDDLQKFYVDHPTLNEGDRATGQTDNLAYMELRGEVARLQEQVARLQSAMAAKMPGASPEQRYYWANEVVSAMSLAGDPKANILRSSLGELRARRAQAATTLGPEHPRIVDIDRELDTVYKQLENDHAALVSDLQRKRQDAEARMQRVAPVEAVRPSVKVTLELSRLTQVNTNNQQIYDRLMESYNRAKLVTGAEFFKVTIVDEARPAIYKPPSLRNRLLIAGAAMFLLLLVVPVAFALYNILLPRIWTVDDVRRLLKVKTLGSIAFRKAPKAKALLHGSSDEGAPRSVVTDPLLLFYGSSYQLEDVEAFRIVREEAENVFRNPARPGKYCLMITSSLPNEGKSTCSCNLAMTFARKGKRTLLVDADFRLGRIARIFNMTVETGLDEILGQQDIPFSQFVEIAPLAYKATMQRDLVVAPRKLANPNAGEMVSSDRFKDFIRLAKEQFDIVIIDTPPVMITPEPLSLAELSDGVIFACRSGSTVASEAREAVDVLKERRVKVVAILNGVRNTPFQSNRYHKYSYYYSVQPTPGEAQSKPG